MNMPIRKPEAVESFDLDPTTTAQIRARQPARRQMVLGLSAVALAIAFNIPYSILAVTYNYPDVLRGSAHDALDLFAKGGASLVLTWHAFAIIALALLPFALAVSLTPERLRQHNGLAVGAAIAGALAGLTQAMGLWRWVFVIPSLARTHADPAASPEAKAAAERAFEVLNLYGGVAIGEHMGQLLTALFIVLLALIQWREASKVTSVTGLITAATIVLGTQEGVAIALGQPGDIFSMATILGYLGLTVWLIQTGITHMRRPRPLKAA
ncbi:hypothetical protein PbB2_01349 [Candidatus Phycosocius bacilliformis]|uniref:DUF4386 domain-containing protein n=1 Tax=Candidatus Phycosocius bacilliformis TaxID=1445552 RepID=A0A2P2E9E0_9PROT|nr:DUF4386 family protein [Candidatus Phycosocius bacilliformis]GBF57680.1 hypothetical protein PbB2_01349 [Candidatus Phycosocius bacilliformis]